MTTNISNVADMVELAEASYANLTNPEIINALTDIGFAETHARSIDARWEIVGGATVGHMPNTEEDGFSATLFQSKVDGSYVFAIRGTEPFTLPPLDVMTDAGTFLNGFSISQTLDMYNYWKYLTSAVGSVYESRGQTHLILVSAIEFYNNTLH